MKKNLIFLIYPLAILCFVIVLTNGCKKDESSKKDPIITWANPDDITYGTLLSANQLNATADVPGSFVYLPSAGTKLNEGANQDLKVEFTPTDDASYNSVSKTVKINVMASGSGVSSAIFNPNLTYGSVTDIDGNIYKTITIGSQTWMAENLRTTRYRDGSAIPKVTDNNAWFFLTTGAYCNYDNTTNSDTIATYGRLYNWYAATDSRNIAPTGWHVPSDAEWTALTDTLGGIDFASGKLKEAGTTHWISPNINATNESGFTAMPGGRRYFDGTFYYLGGQGYHWCTRQHVYDPEDAYMRVFYCDSKWVNEDSDFKVTGFSIRCLKD